MKTFVTRFLWPCEQHTTPFLTNSQLVIRKVRPCGNKQRHQGSTLILLDKSSECRGLIGCSRLLRSIGIYSVGNANRESDKKQKTEREFQKT